MSRKILIMGKIHDIDIARENEKQKKIELIAQVGKFHLGTKGC